MQKPRLMTRRFRQIRLGSGGRGAQYPLFKGVLESTLRILFVRDWPARLWSRFPGAREVRVVQHELPLLGKGRRLRVAFVSDLHLGPTTPAETLEHAFDALQAARPDILLLGGDYVFLDATPRVGEHLSRLVARVSAPLKYAVWGNHDLWTDHDLLEHALREAGVKMLVNQAVTLPPPFDDVAILGLDDPWTGEPNAEQALAQCQGARIRLAVSHSPDGAVFLRDRAIQLMVCGHTHGGQIALPGGRPVVLPPGPYSKRYHTGFYEVEGLPIFVSRGVGGVELPIRSYAPPEVVLFDLV